MGEDEGVLLGEGQLGEAGQKKEVVVGAEELGLG